MVLFDLFSCRPLGRGSSSFFCKLTSYRLFAFLPNPKQMVGKHSVLVAYIPLQKSLPKNKLNLKTGKKYYCENEKSWQKNKQTNKNC